MLTVLAKVPTGFTVNERLTESRVGQETMIPVGRTARDRQTEPVSRGRGGGRGTMECWPTVAPFAMERARARFVDNTDQLIDRQQLIAAAVWRRRRCLPRENIPRKNNGQRTRAPAPSATAARLPPKKKKEKNSASASRYRVIINFPFYNHRARVRVIKYYQDYYHRRRYTIIFFFFPYFVWFSTPQRRRRHHRRRRRRLTSG